MRLTIRIANALRLLSLALLTGCAVAHAPVAREVAEPTVAATTTRVAHAYGRLPRMFEINQGQADREVKFLSRGGDYTLLLTGTEVVLVPADGAAALRLTLVGANPEPRTVGVEELPTRVNYFIGADPAGWHTDVPTYARVRQASVYRGIDLVYHAAHGQLEFDFVVAPGADPAVITLDLRGAAALHLGPDGHLLAHTPAGDMQLRRPLVYQEVDGQRRAVPGRYVPRGETRVGFEVGAYDAGRPLVIDPVVTYATTVAGTNAEEIRGIAVDPAGNLYMTGWTFPFSGPSMSDAFVAKLNPSGSALVYMTYFGGSGVDRGNGVAVDRSGVAYVTGVTTSTNFPHTPGLLGGDSDAFVASFDQSRGALDRVLLLGGDADEEGMAIAVAPRAFTGDVYVTGWTTSTNLPTTAPSAIQRTNAGDRDAFVAILSQSLNFLLYSTYLGGTGYDVATALAVDSNTNIYVTGFTTSSDLPTTPGALQRAHGGSAGDVNAFVAKLDHFRTVPVYLTYLGGHGAFGAGIAVDGAGNAYVTGVTGRFVCNQPPPQPPCRTDLNDFPTTSGAFQTASPDAPDNTISSSGDAFVTKLNPAGSALVYSTYLGGRKGDGAAGIAVDRFGNAYVAGRTDSPNFPTLNPVQPPTSTVEGFTDGFVAKLNPTGAALVYSSFLGGTDSDDARGVVVDATGNAYVFGGTRSADFPTVNPLQGNGTDGIPRSFVMRLNASDTATAAPGQTVSVSTSPGVAGEAGVSATLTNNGSFGGNASVTAENFSANPTGARVIDVGGRYVDLKVSGADASDRLTARFYYPTTVSDGVTTLLYFNGFGWSPVRSSGQVDPDVDFTNNLDGTISGGRFTVVFDATSTPPITALTGTPLTTAVASAADGLALLASRVDVLPLRRGEKRELLRELQDAQRALAHGHVRHAIHELREFVHELRELRRSRQIDPAAAVALTTLAGAIRRDLASTAAASR